MNRFEGMLIRGREVAPQGTAGDASVGGRVAAAKLAELVQLSLAADAAIVDLRPYATRQRAIGAVERLETSGVLLPGSAPEHSEAMLWRLADPIEAKASGFASYISVPLSDIDGMPLGRIVTMQFGNRTFDRHDIKVLRTIADIVANLLREPQLAN